MPEGTSGGERILPDYPADHYRKAQKLIEEAGFTDDLHVANYYVALAQVHATLALAESARPEGR